MRFSSVALILLAVTATPALAKDIYRDGRYAVRKVEQACTLQISLYPSDMKEKAPAGGESAMAMLGFYNGEFYDEVFTERKTIGSARKVLKLTFDQGRPREVTFLEKAAGNDDTWRWQRLNNSDGLTDAIKKSGKMQVSIFNGQKWFDFTVPLKGSSKAVTELSRCK